MEIDWKAHRTKSVIALPEVRLIDGLVDLMIAVEALLDHRNSAVLTVAENNNAEKP